MATKNNSKSASSNFFTVSIFFFSLFIFTINAAENSDYTFVRAMDPISIINSQQEKLSHFRFYFHDTLSASGKSPTTITVVPPPLPLNDSATKFGLIDMMDNPLTLGPEISSKLVGRAQGLYASASQEEFALLMAMNFAFIEGKYNGSTITVMGRNPIFNAVREMPVIGGSGIFRFARGYAQAKTHTFDPKTNDAVVEYNVYVLHY